MPVELDEQLLGLVLREFEMGQQMQHRRAGGLTREAPQLTQALDQPGAVGAFGGEQRHEALPGWIADSVRHDPSCPNLPCRDGPTRAAPRP